MSALPPKADILGIVAKSLLMTHSGHWLDYGFKSRINEKRGFRTHLLPRGGSD